MSRIGIVALIVLVFANVTSAIIINIPADSSTIQGGINVAGNGDTVLVQPGTYTENINFIGRDIIVGSLFLTTGDTGYISSTVIDGDSSATVVVFNSGEDSTTCLMGFKIIKGYYSPYGGGIGCESSSPAIRDCILTGNFGDMGGGIKCSNS